MRNILKKATLGVALGATALTFAAPAEAQRWGRGYGRYHHRHDSTGPAIVAGVAGLAIGAAIASSNNRDRRYNNDRYYYDNYPRRPAYNGYYDRPYNDGYYEQCYVRRVYDPYIDRYVRIRDC